MDKERTLRQFPPYGSMGAQLTGDTCPTCRGKGRIPRGHEDQLVAVIPCNDVRLRPRHTKLYVCASMAMCIFLCCLILFFLFPRSVTLTPVSVLSVMVYLNLKNVELEVTSLINITNANYVPVNIVEFRVQGLVCGVVTGKTKISNMTGIPSRSKKLYTINTDVLLTDPGLCNYCKSGSIKIHTVFLELQMTVIISYLSHMEQLSLDTYAYIDCGTNRTTPHPMG